MSYQQYNERLCDYISRSTTPYHAIKNSMGILDAAGYVRLYESDPWQHLSPGRYYVTRNSSSLIGFQITPTANTLRMAGSHTDSPSLRVKPNPLHTKSGYLQLGVEVYGGALLNPWFDRDLSMAGRVIWHTEDDIMQSSLIDFRRPVAVIPSLAIHFDREANTGKEINKQTDMVPLLMLDSGTKPMHFNELLKKQFLLEHPGNDHAEIIDYDLFLYDSQPPALVGLEQEFITSARLDNLLSCYCIIQAAASCSQAHNLLFVLNDHEEVGSVSTSGAQGPFLQSILSRLYPERPVRESMLAKSLLISVDNAHAVHPNFASKHEPQHLPVLNGGPVIKTNANQRYASNACTSSIFKLLCKRNEIPVQNFVMRNDMACGSTIGPLTSAAIGIPTIDIGVPQLAMHSIRETIGNRDGYYLGKALSAFFEEHDEKLQCAEAA
ncbi:M18 family aminopeptidase [Desulfogranum japonicum]|uniref:M18 family aminopeptidase n=1 Tax=Desulfogranum japonicum TaxID=231447 RepID=UPI000416EDA0|nr:M18 family aminopeptidase [Desulfogranum japonicum]